MQILTKDLLDLSKTIGGSYLNGFDNPWKALRGINDYIIQLGNTLSKQNFTLVSENIWISKNADISKSASITGPCIIDEGAEIRHCAFIRGSVIIGKGTVIGNSTELKNCILFDGVQVPHFNYIGDSILGYKSHFGAGSVTSNVKSDKSLISIRTENEVIKTEQKKFGAIVGDFCEIGCNSVLCPGTILGRNVTIYPSSMVRGYIHENSIYKSSNAIVTKQ